MKTGRILAIWLFAVTAMMAGAWAQTPNYPQQAPSQQGSNREAAPQAQQQDNPQQDTGGQADPQDQDNPQESNEQAAPQTQNYPQQAPGDQRPSLQGSGTQGPGGPGPNGESTQKSEGPAPNVARISLIHGDVSMQRGDAGGWAATTINAPLMLGDQVATGEKSRTEIQLDYAGFLRLAAKSQVKIADLSRTRIQVQVAKGYASYTVFKGGEADVEIDSPNVAVHPLKPGRYRVQVNSDSETDVIVREGEAEITTPQGSTRVKEGEIITIRGTDNPEYKVSNAPDKDDWDRWNKDRDSVIKEAEGPQRTNRYYTGANDLDGYGRWVYVPGYGNVWQPYQQATWAPYQTGRWVWEPYYGWTWVSYEPWGWAPYHYGRWFLNDNSWCWWPGPVGVGYRPLWSPAFVFFVGFGHRSGFGFGSIGWFPVGPHDAFFPWYGRGFNRVNVVSFSSINAINRPVGFVAPLAIRGRQPFFSNANLALTNARVRGSITSVSSADFGRGGNAGLRHGAEEHELRDSHVMTANLPVVPTRESLHSGSGNGAAPSGIQTRDSGRFFTQHQPPAGPESFHDQAARVQRVVGPQATSATSAGTQGNTGGGVNVRPGNSGANANAGVNVRTGNAEVPRTGGASTGGTTAGNGRGSVPSETGRTVDTRGDANNRDSGGWNKFGTPTGRTTGSASESGRVDQTPSSATRSNGRQAGDQGGSKPPLDLHRPIVTPRQPEVRNEQRNMPPPSRTPDVRNQPRSSQPQQRSESRQSQRSSGSSSHSSGGNRGGHSDSKSSSSPKQR